MANLSLFWTKTAIKQRNITFKYWNNRNKSNSYSTKLNNSIRERTELLKSNYSLGKKTTLKNTRAISLGHYSILYRKIDSRIIIMGFWDKRQDPKKLLNFLKEK